MTAVAENSFLPPSPTDLRRLTLPVAVVGTGLAGAAALLFIGNLPAGKSVAGVAALLAAALLAETFPVSIEGIAFGAISLAPVFVVGAATIYGWEAAALVGFTARAAIELARHRPATRLLYDGANYALAGAAAGATAGLVGSGSVALVAAEAISGAFAFYVVHLTLVVALVARSTGEAAGPLLRGSLAWSVVPLAIIASLTLALEV